MRSARKPYTLRVWLALSPMRYPRRALTVSATIVDNAGPQEGGSTPPLDGLIGAPHSLQWALTKARAHQTMLRPRQIHLPNFKLRALMNG